MTNTRTRHRPDIAAPNHCRDVSEAPIPLGAHVTTEERILAHLPLARLAALRYRNTFEDLDDLIQVARIGLIKAARRYNPGRGRFEVYAAITMRGELQRHFRDCAYLVRARDMPGRPITVPMQEWQEPRSDGGMSQAEDRVYLRALIDRLTPREREAVGCTLVFDMTATATSAATGISQPTVSRARDRALSKMRAWSGGRWGRNAFPPEVRISR